MRAHAGTWQTKSGRYPAAVSDAYHTVSRALAGTPGLIRNDLLRAADDPERVLVASEWESAESFQAWERGADHRPTTAPLRGFHDRTRDRPFEILEVIASY